MRPWLDHVFKAFLLLGLVLWLGFWPAVDAATGVSRTIYVISAPGGTEFVCDKIGSNSPPEDVPACCGSTCDPEPAAPGCSGAGCGRCFCNGSLVLFVPDDSAVVPELEPAGRVLSGDLKATTRSLKPPVPPPIIDLPITA